MIYGFGKQQERDRLVQKKIEKIFLLNDFLFCLIAD